MGKSKNKKIFFQGTFDILNVGHVRAFKLAKQHGNYLVVGLNSDSLIRWFKRREPIMPFSQRKEILEAVKWIDEVIECNEPNPINYLKKHDISVYVLTDEWKEANREPIDYIQKKGGKVVFSPRFGDILFGTQIRKKIFDEFQKEVEKFKN